MVYGDLLKSECDVIVHGCNCFKTMGAGIAKQIREIYPGAYEADLNYGFKGDRTKLGTYSSWTGPNHYLPDKMVTVVNLYTQYKYTGRNNFSYDAFEVGLEKVFGNFPKDYVIGIPRIGAGLAGGDWEKISDIIHKLSEQYNRKVLLFEIDEVLRAYRLCKKFSLKLRGVIHYKFELTMLFDTTEEADEAHSKLEKQMKLISGWWYGWNRWRELLKEENKEYLEKLVITDFSKYQ